MKFNSCTAILYLVRVQYIKGTLLNHLKTCSEIGKYYAVFIDRCQQWLFN